MPYSDFALVLNYLGVSIATSGRREQVRVPFRYFKIRTTVMFFIRSLYLTFVCILYLLILFCQVSKIKEL